MYVETAEWAVFRAHQTPTTQPRVESPLRDPTTHAEEIPMRYGKERPHPLALVVRRRRPPTEPEKEALAAALDYICRTYVDAKDPEEERKS